jgi:heme exporter protein D
MKNKEENLLEYAKKTRELDLLKMEEDLLEKAKALHNSMIGKAIVGVLLLLNAIISWVCVFFLLPFGVNNFYRFMVELTVSFTVFTMFGVVSQDLKKFRTLAQQVKDVKARYEERKQRIDKEFNINQKTERLVN